MYNDSTNSCTGLLSYYNSTLDIFEINITTSQDSGTFTFEFCNFQISENGNVAVHFQDSIGPMNYTIGEPLNFNYPWVHQPTFKDSTYTTLVSQLDIDSYSLEQSASFYIAAATNYDTIVTPRVDLKIAKCLPDFIYDLSQSVSDYWSPADNAYLFILPVETSPSKYYWDSMADGVLGSTNHQICETNFTLTVDYSTGSTWDMGFDYSTSTWWVFQTYPATYEGTLGLQDKYGNQKAFNIKVQVVNKCSASGGP